LDLNESLPERHEVTAVASYKLEVDDDPSSEDVEALAKGLNDHALGYTEVAGFREIGVFMRDEHGVLVGGVWGYVNWNWLWIGAVWLSDALRGAGYGRQMMETIELAGRERGCRYSHLDTFSFQARPFYEGLGYEVFAMLDDYPPGHQRFFMKKELI
jgi:GNAT superfamily N-acetyltransferase